MVARRSSEHQRRHHAARAGAHHAAGMVHRSGNATAAEAAENGPHRAQRQFLRHHLRHGLHKVAREVQHRVLQGLGAGGNVHEEIFQALLGGVLQALRELVLALLDARVFHVQGADGRGHLG
ncbi:MAG: hypothetical protein ACK56I_19530, partial [bacterium]